MAETSGPHVTATRARGGRYGRHIFWVLVISTVLAAGGLFAAWGWKAPAMHQANIEETTAKGNASFDTPAPPPSTPAQPTAPRP